MYGGISLKGPALLAYNNAVFEEDDWKGIQKPAQSVKGKDVLKVGRFGIGFSSVYHITDLPCIISKDLFAIIDPFEDYFRDLQSGRPQSGFQCSLDQFDDEAHVDQLKPFTEQSIPNISTLQSHHFDGTIFRFPLRQSPSELCDKVYDEKMTMDLFNAFLSDADIVLLFIRNVSKILVKVRKDGADLLTPLVEVSLSSDSQYSLKNERISFVETLRHFPSQFDADVKRSEVFKVNCKSMGKEAVSVTWVVHHLVSFKGSDVLKSLSEKLKLLPWIGIAVPLSHDKEIDNVGIQPLKSSRQMGRIFCFFPLPAGEESLSCLPIHIHGYFGVSDDRRSIKWPGEDQIQNDTTKWNKELVDRLLPFAYESAILETIRESSQRKLGSKFVYRAFPDVRKDLGHFANAVQSMFQRLLYQPVLFHEESREWIKIQDAIVSTLANDKENTQVVVKCLQKGEVKVIEDLPPSVLAALERVDATYVTPDLVIATLRKQDISFYTYKERLLLLEYFLENKSSFTKLCDMELLPTADGNFVKILVDPSPADCVYVATESLPMTLVPGLCRRFLAVLQEEFKALQDLLQQLVEKDSIEQLRKLDAKLVVDLLREALPSDWNKGVSIDWNSHDHDQPPFSWLQEFWQFAYLHLNSEAKFKFLQEINLIPVSDFKDEPIVLAALKVNSAIIHCVADNERDYQNVVHILKKLGVLVCQLPSFVTDHPIMSSKLYVQFFSPQGVLQVMYNTKELIANICKPSNIDLQRHINSNLLPYLSDAEFSPLDRDFLRSLRIFSAGHMIGQSTPDIFTCLHSEAFFLENHVTLPKVKLPKLFFLCESERNRVLLSKLGVRPKSDDEVIESILKCARQGFYSKSEIQPLIEWIRVHFDTIRDNSCIVDCLRLLQFVSCGEEMEGLLKMPKQLFDRDETLMSLFQDSELFPSAEFYSEDWRRILKVLGLKFLNAVTSEEIHKIAMKGVRNKEQTNALIEILNKRSSILYDLVDKQIRLCDTLHQLSFIPIELNRPPAYPEHLKWKSEMQDFASPADICIHSPENYLLAGSIIPFTELLTQDVYRRLSVKSKPSCKDVMKQLQEIMKCKEIRNLHHITQTIYKYINDNVQTLDMSDKAILQTQKCFLVYETFVSIDMLAVESDEVPPYLFQIPYTLKEFNNLIEISGIQLRFDSRQLLKALKSIRENHNGRALGNQQLHLVISSVIKPLVDIANENPEQFSQYFAEVLLPDTKGVLRKGTELIFNDVSWVKSKDSDYICHENIPVGYAKALGVRDVRAQMLEKYSQGLPTMNYLGEDFGQSEKLTNRIKRILDGYRCDESVLKEIVQNADDAGATEVHFILDSRDHPSEFIFGDSMAVLQGPALLSYNNRPFTDEDIRGIQNLGEGSKSNQLEKAGRYGVGFNVVYHLTDCPMFLSDENTLCIMDPTLKYTPGATSASPGRMYRPVTDEMKQKFSDIFNCFFCFSKFVKLENGTLFRLPLRKCLSDIGDQVTVDTVTTLFESFKKEIFDVLLFLKNVRDIKMSYVNSSNGALQNTYHVKASIGEKDLELKKKFSSSVGGHSKRKTSLPDIEIQTNGYEIRLENNDGYIEKWRVQQSFGIGANLCTEELCRAQKTYSLLPRGGVALRTECSFAPDRKGKKQSDVEMSWRKSMKHKIYCFLPLPIETDLPVHVEGYFALGHEDRRNLFHDSSTDIRNLWNTFVFEQLVVPSYVEVIEQKKAVITTTIEARKWTQKEVQTLMKTFFDIFPCSSWKEGHHAFYQLLENKVSKSEIFPVLFKERYESKETAKNRDEYGICIEWKSCLSSSSKPGYFNDLNCQMKDYGAKHQSTELSDVLLDLRFPLIDAPMKIFKDFESTLNMSNTGFSFKVRKSPFILKINQESVINFLKSTAVNDRLHGLPKPINETIIQKSETLSTILTYIAHKNGGVSDLLDGLPLLLTADNRLSTFSRQPDFKVFHSEYLDIIPEFSSEFLHNKLLAILPEDAPVFKQLTMVELSNKLPNSAHSSCDSFWTPWDPNNFSRVRWLKLLWRFLSKRQNTRYQYSTSASRKISTDEFKTKARKAMGNVAIIPVKTGSDHYLMNLFSSQYAVNTFDSLYHKAVGHILKKLDCPILDCNSPHNDYYSSSFSEQFVSKIESPIEMCTVFRKLLDTNKEKITKLDGIDKAEILCFFNSQPPLCYTVEHTKFLNALPCFRSIQGNYVSLETAQTVYTVVTSNLCLYDEKIWAHKPKTILLQSCPSLKQLYDALNVKALSRSALYKMLILPCFQSLSNIGKLKHLKAMKDLVLNTRSELDKTPLVWDLDLHNQSIVPNKDGSYVSAGQLYDHSDPVFACMLSNDKFLAENVRNYEWMTFFKLIGLKAIVTAEDFRVFVYKCKAENQAQELVKYFCKSHNIHSDQYVLRDLRSHPFIPAYHSLQSITELEQVCSRVNKTNVSFEAVPHKFAYLVWSTCSLLPEWCSKLFQETFDNSICRERCANALEMISKPPMPQILKHLQNVCFALSIDKSKKVSENIKLRGNKQAYNDLLIKILQYFQDECETSIGSCSDKDQCCNSCKEIVEKLTDIPFVPIEDGTLLLKAKMVTKNINNRDFPRINVFLKEIPNFMLPFLDIFKLLGATNEPSLAQFAAILDMVGTKKQNITNNPNAMAAVQQVINGFFILLDRDIQTAKDDLKLQQVERLFFLPSPTNHPAVEKKVYLSSEIYYNDDIRYSYRLKNLHVPALLTIKPENHTFKNREEKIIECLPQHLRPNFLSKHVTEEILTDLENKRCHPCYCQVVKILSSTMNMPQFSNILRAIAAYEGASQGDDAITEQMSKLQASSFNIICMTELKTVLHFEGFEIQSSVTDKTVLLKESNNSATSVDVYVAKNYGNLAAEMAKELNKYLDNLLVNLHPLAAVLGARDADGVRKALNESGIRLDIEDSQQLSLYPPLGTNIEDDILCLLDQDPDPIFSIDEFVGYDKGGDSEECYVYAKVIEMKLPDIDSESPEWKRKYTIDIGEKTPTGVDSFRLASFIVLEEIAEDSLVAYPTASTLNSVSINEETMPPELKSIMLQVKSELFEIFKLSHAEKRKALRKLFLKWHPDRNRECSFAVQIFQFIQQKVGEFEKDNASELIQQISQLPPTERRKPFQRLLRKWHPHGQEYDFTNVYEHIINEMSSIENLSEMCEGVKKSVEKTFQDRKRYKKNVSKLKKFASFQRRSRSYITPPSLKVVPQEVKQSRQLLKQAKHDIEMARKCIMEVTDPSYEWICTICYFGVEKSIKAIQVSQDIYCESNDLLEMSNTICNFLLLSPLVEKLQQIVAEGDHYPNISLYPKVPNDLFDANKGKNAIEIASKILVKISAFMQELTEGE